MKVWIDQDLCTGDGLCEEIAPAVFTLLDDGLAYVKEGDKVFSDPGGAEGLARSPTTCSTRSSNPPRSAPASASSSRLTESGAAQAPKAFPVFTGTKRPCAARTQDRIDLLVRERVRGPVATGVDRERHPDHVARRVSTSAPPESPGASFEASTYTCRRLEPVR